MLVRVDVGQIDRETRWGLYTMGILDAMEGEALLEKDLAIKLLAPPTQEERSSRQAGLRPETPAEKARRESINRECAQWEELEAQANGKYGSLRRRYLRENKPEEMQAYFAGEGLIPHLAQVEREAQGRMTVLVPQLARAAGAIEELKARDMLAWVGLMNNCHMRAEEMVLAELVYV